MFEPNMLRLNFLFISALQFDTFFQCFRFIFLYNYIELKYRCSHIWNSLNFVLSYDISIKWLNELQLVQKDPEAAIVLFWKAINAGDRVDSALKDMAVVMKQLDRSEEAIEAIKSFRRFCSKQAQESLDNVLIDLYKVHTTHA